MRFGATVVLASALLVSLASQAQAQGQRGGRGGGFGGPGGGGGTAGLLMIEEVRKEVGISEDQLGKIREALQGLGGGRGAPGAGGGRTNFQDMSEEERAKFREEMQKQAEELAKKSEEILKANLDAKQLGRLEELRIQREGAGALARAEVAAKLKLTDDQKETIKTALASGQMDFRAFGRDASPEDRQKAMQEFQAKREKANADALAVLTAEQKTAFGAMQGAKFEFPQGGFGGGGRPPGGRPPGGRPPAGND